MKQFAALALLLVAFTFGANAQCTPDQSITTPGFYPGPDSLPCVERGVLFDTVLQFKNFTTIDAADFGIPFPVTITVNWVRVDSIGGLPNGLSYACSPSNCQFPSGSNGCINFTGTTNDAAGLYNLTIYATVNVDVPGFGNGIEQAGTSDDLGFPVFLNVIDSGAPCPAPVVSVVNEPLFACPGQGATILLGIDTGGAVAPFTYAWSPSAGLSNANIANPIASVTASTTFTVTVTDANGYEFTTSTTVDIDNSPAPVADFNFTVTGGNTVTFTDLSANGTSLTWNFGDGTTSSAANPTQSYTSLDEFNVTLIVSNNCGTDTIVKTVAITGITDVAGNDLNVSVYPNPTKGLFNVSLNGTTSSETQVNVYDLQGRKVNTTNLQSNGSTMDALIDLSGNGSGIYIVKVLSGSQVSTHKLVIQ
jgi:PKD repeat protein